MEVPSQRTRDAYARAVTRENKFLPMRRRSGLVFCSARFVASKLFPTCFPLHLRPVSIGRVYRTKGIKKREKLAISPQADSRKGEIVRGSIRRDYAMGTTGFFVISRALWDKRFLLEIHWVPLQFLWLINAQLQTSRPYERFNRKLRNSGYSSSRGGKFFGNFWSRQNFTFNGTIHVRMQDGSA